MRNMDKNPQAYVTKIPLPERGTDNNGEITSRRHLILSTVCRRVEGVRHIDIDMAQTCPRCLQPECFMEATSSNHRNFNLTTRLAQVFRVPSLLVVHGGYSGVDKIRYCDSIEVFGRARIDEKPLALPDITTWHDLDGYLERLNDNHSCQIANDRWDVIK